VRRRLWDGTLRVSEAARPVEPVETLYDEGISELLPRVTEVFSEITGIEPAQITPESHFRYDLGGDSLTYLSLIEKLSETFGVTIDTEAAPDLSTPRDFAAYILKESE